MTLQELPPAYPGTRDALHQIAFFAVAPARYRSVGRMGLKDTPGGFGTPDFEGRVARVEGDLLIHEQNGNSATQTISTIRAATEFFGGGYTVDWFQDFHDPLSPADPDNTLAIDAGAAHGLGAWFEFGFDVLNRLREHGAAADDVARTFRSGHGAGRLRKRSAGEFRGVTWRCRTSRALFVRSVVVGDRSRQSLLEQREFQRREPRLRGVARLGRSGRHCPGVLPTGL